jgi:hypothetical protein
MKKIISEAINVGTFNDFIHPEKRRRWESGSSEVNEILGILPDNAQEYFEMLLSKSYKKLMERLVSYTGVAAENMTHGVLGQCMQAIQKCISIERHNKRTLENLALECVLDMEEFKFVKQSYHDGEIEFDVKLSHGELENAVSKAELEMQQEETDEEGDLTEGEEQNFNLAEELFDDTEKKLRRRLANTLTQGIAVDSLYLFNLVNERLIQLNGGDDDIVKLYGLASTGAQIGYYMAPPDIEGGAGQQQGSSAGSEEVSDMGNGKYKIKARGMIFPYLLHEIIKGVYEYLHLSDITKSVEKQDTLEDETTDIASGPELGRIIKSMIPADKLSLVGAVQQRILNDLVDIDDIKTVLKGGREGQEIINGIIAEIEQEMGPEEEDEPYRDTE